MSTPDTPVVDRQYISEVVENDLKAACRLLVEQTGNAHHNSQEDALANLSNLKRAAKLKSNTQAANHEGASSTTANDASRSTTRPEGSSTVPAKIQASTKADPARTKFGHDRNRTKFPARTDSLMHKNRTASKVNPVSEYARITRSERPRTAPEVIDSSDASCASPDTIDTDYHGQSSTHDFAALMQGNSSMIQSKSNLSNFLDTQSYVEATARADRQAAEMMRLHHQQSSQNLSHHPTLSAENQERKPTRSFGNFMRGRSRSRSGSGADAVPLVRKTSLMSGLRNGFGLRKKTSSSGLRDVPSDPPKHEKQHEAHDMDLNRALPPLPAANVLEHDDCEEESSSQETVKVYNDTAMVNNSRPRDTLTPLVPVQDTQAARARDRSPSVGRHVLPVGSVAGVSARKFSNAESTTTSADSCFSPADTTTPKRSMDVMKAASIVRSHSLDNVRLQQQIQKRKDSMAAAKSTPAKSNTTASSSRQGSRPPSRNKSTAPPRYSIIPHQRNASQPNGSIKSASSSVVNIPARPSTRDATSLPSRSRLPSVGQHSIHSFPSPPPVPHNFSRPKTAPDNSRPATSSGLQTSMNAADLAEEVKIEDERKDKEITALPNMPKKQFGLRRMLSSIHRNKAKSHIHARDERNGAKSALAQRAIHT